MPELRYSLIPPNVEDYELSKPYAIVIQQAMSLILLNHNVLPVCHYL